jgi:hypothetical protein
MDESAVETPSETPGKDSSTEGEGKPKKRTSNSPTQQPEEHPDAKKIAVEAEGDSKVVTDAVVTIMDESGTADDDQTKKTRLCKATSGPASVKR